MPVSEAATTQEAPPKAEDASTKLFPCDGCGADLRFSIGEQNLECPYCGHVKVIEAAPDAEVAEQDFQAMLQRLAELRDAARPDEPGFRELRCDGCGATVRFQGTFTSRECPYCDVALQIENAHDAPNRIGVDGVLAFQVDRQKAHTNLTAWVRSRWFAPNDFVKRGVEGRFNGIYLPYWTYDSMTNTHYTGQRGEHYWVTVGSGKNRRRVRRTRWYPASGSFQRFFDDVLTLAATGLPEKRILALEPWPLNQCVPFSGGLLAGFLARTYDVPLDEGFVTAKARMDEAIRDDVRARIGGDTQRIHTCNTRHEAITYKHLLLPLWMLTYRYGKKLYQIVVNAGTGEVQGDRPYSWVKILLSALAGATAIFAVWFLVSHNG